MCYAKCMKTKLFCLWNILCQVMDGLAIGLYRLTVCCDALRTSPCVVQTTVIEHLQFLVLFLLKVIQFVKNT